MGLIDVNNRISLNTRVIFDMIGKCKMLILYTLNKYQLTTGSYQISIVVVCIW